jgi:hypothetical protein
MRWAVARGARVGTWHTQAYLHTVAARVRERKHKQKNAEVASEVDVGLKRSVDDVHGQVYLRQDEDPSEVDAQQQQDEQLKQCLPELPSLVNHHCLGDAHHKQRGV